MKQTNQLVIPYKTNRQTDGRTDGRTGDDDRPAVVSQPVDDPEDIMLVFRDRNVQMTC